MKNLVKYCVLLILVFPQIVLAKINIVTTIKPLHSLVSAVVDNVNAPNADGKMEKEVELKLLLNYKSSPHHYSLKPSDMQALEKADIIFFIDKDLEKFIPKFINANKNPKQEIIEISQASGIVLLPLNKKFSINKSASESKDPHLWLSPENAKRIVQIIADVMCEYDIDNADSYQSNANAYIEHIKSVDNKIHYLMNEVKYKPFVVSHDAYQYFVKHYGLNFKGALTLDDQHIPGAGSLNKFKRLIEREKVKHVFGEARESNRFLKSAIGKGIKICYLDAEWGVNQAQSHKKDSEAYLIMLQNLGDNIYACLSSSITNSVPNR
jgi:zinc transport system substrate-binding protein